MDSNSSPSTVSELGLDPNQLSYTLSKTQISELRRMATGGDCAASLLLAKYYLYGVLELDAGISWLRLAARCPNVDVKAYLASTLLEYENYAEVSQEIDGLVQEIRKLDSSRAAEIEKKIALKNDVLLPRDIRSEE